MPRKLSSDAVLLRALYQEQKITQQEASDVLGVTENQFSNYVRGITSVPPEVIRDARAQWGNPDGRFIRLPRFGSVPRGPIDLDDPESTEAVPSLVAKSGRFVVGVGDYAPGVPLLIKGRDIVVVDPDASVAPGRLCLVEEGGSVRFHKMPVDPFADPGAQILGLVVAIVRDPHNERLVLVWDEAGVVV